MRVRVASCTCTCKLFRDTSKATFASTDEVEPRGRDVTVVQVDNWASVSRTTQGSLTGHG